MFGHIGRMNRFPKGEKDIPFEENTCAMDIWIEKKRQNEISLELKMGRKRIGENWLSMAIKYSVLGT